MALTFLWHDYETFGANTRSARPAQFAGVRTDADLNPLGEPHQWFCQPADDFLPEPEACLITGITPQLARQRGIPEADFAREVHQALSWPGTVGVGYNSIRFDDEITRHLFWRNLIDPYGREWQSDCGRWDLLDVLRLAHALRPQGLEWPRNAEGATSFKLGDLTAANGLVHEAAHDALSDVQATVALARRLKSAQPRLWDFALGLHRKARVLDELGLPCAPDQAKPFWHVSGMFAPQRGCLALMWPLATHPHNPNEILAWDLAQDPAELADLNAAAIRQRLFTRASDLPEGVTRLPIKSVHINRSPMVVGTLRVVGQPLLDRWGIDLARQLDHAAHAQALPDLSAIWAEVFAPGEPTAVDVDEALYGGFIGAADRRLLDALRQLPPQQLAQASPRFADPRLPELFWRYQARNALDCLPPEQQARWQEHRRARLLRGQGGALTLTALAEKIDALAETASERDQAILEALYDHAEAIAP